MKFFVDTADIAEIRELQDAGLIDGVTTNPSLITKAGRPMRDIVAEICDVTEGPVSAEVTALEAEEMIREGRILAEIADNVCVKVPLTLAGLKACKELTGEGHMVNVTLCFSAVQALLAAKAGATFISPFIGRLDDINLDGMALIADISAAASITRRRASVSRSGATPVASMPSISGSGSKAAGARSAIRATRPGGESV